MKKVLMFFMLFATIGTANIYAQKKVLVVDYFESTDRDEKYSDEIRNQVISGIQSTGRLNIIDAYSELSLRIEDTSVLSEEASQDANRLKVIQDLGAEFILIGSIDNILIEKKTTESKNEFFTAEVKVTLKFLNATDGALHASKTVTTFGGGALLGAGSTEQKAITGAISAISGQMARIIDEHFPIKGSLVEVGETKKTKMVSCFIDLGEIHGVSQGQYLKVSQIKEIAGRQSALEIGRIKIESIVAPDLSECKVLKGQEEMLTAFNNGVELVVETIKARGLMGGLESLSE